MDDEILGLKLLKRLLKQSEYIKIIGEFTNPTVALEKIPKLKPDVIFLDVEMPEINGIELGTKLLKNDDDMDIVFVTAYERYAIHAFKLNAVNYILKPVDKKSIKDTIERIMKKRKNTKQLRNNDVNISLFGEVCILRKEDDKKVNWITSKVEELFALLIINIEKGINKWKIIDILWGESEIDKSQQNLYTTIYRLKKTLKEAGIKATIENNVGVYSMTLENIFCDLFEFQAFINKKITVNKETISEFERAISLYKGDLFEGKDYQWSIADREAYHEKFVELVKAVAVYYSQSNLSNKLKKLYKRVAFLLQKEDLLGMEDIFRQKF